MIRLWNPSLNEQWPLNWLSEWNEASLNVSTEILSEIYAENNTKVKHDETLSPDREDAYIILWVMQME